MTDQMVQILIGDALEKLRELPSESVHCVVTSPPYWGLRDYSKCVCTFYHSDSGDPDCPSCHGTGVLDDVKEHQLGLEETHDKYIQNLVEVFREVRRVLRIDGTLWLVLGDSYAGSQNSGGKNSISGKGKAQPPLSFRRVTDLKPKNLIGIPWKVAFALQADGWYLRSDVIWHKPNPVPESVQDRPTKTHEYIFLLTKSKRYFFDAESLRGRYMYPYERRDLAHLRVRTVWSVPTQRYYDAHYARFPEEIPERCIKLGTSEKGCCAKCGSPYERTEKKLSLGWQQICECDAEVIPCTVLDPFAGTGTTGWVAKKLGRKAILIELNPQYAAMIQKQVMSDVPNILSFAGDRNESSNGNQTEHSLAGDDGHGYDVRNQESEDQ